MNRLTLLGAGGATSGGGGAITFDPANTSPNLTLTAGNLTIANLTGSGTPASSRDTGSVSADGTYNVLFTGLGAGISSFVCWIGIANATFDVTTDPASGSNSCIEFPTGDVFGSSSGTGPGYAATDTSFGVKVVISGGGTTRTVQFGHNGTFSGTIFTTLPTGPLYFIAGITTGATTITILSSAWV